MSEKNPVREKLSTAYFKSAVAVWSRYKNVGSSATESRKMSGGNFTVSYARLVCVNAWSSHRPVVRRQYRYSVGWRWVSPMSQTPCAGADRRWFAAHPRCCRTPSVHHGGRDTRPAEPSPPAPTTCSTNKAVIHHRTLQPRCCHMTCSLVGPE